MEYDVVIVGAGAAGLSAANTLKKSGITNILVVEAQDYTGGRVRTSHDWGAPIELGAEAIHGKDTATWPYLKQINITTLQDVPVRIRKLVDSKNRILDKTLVERFNYLHHACAMKGEWGVSLADYVAKLSIAGEEDLAALVTGSLRDLEANDASILDSGHYAHLSMMAPDHAQHWVLPNGYDQVIQGIAEGMPVRLNTVVQQINWENSPVTITLASGEIVTAKHVIVTVSLGVLQAADIDFIPRLPEEKIKAIKSIGMGHTAKLLMKFSDPVIAAKVVNDGYSAESRIVHTLGTVSSWWVAAGDATVLVGFMGGSQSDRAAALGEEKLIQTALTEISRLTGIDAKSKFVRGNMINWADNPFVKGSYSNNPLGMANDAREKLAAPLSNRVYFAGEASVTNADYGTVHGALESGERAATEILQQISNLKSLPAS